MKTAILGAGVSGLALARSMVERGFAASDLHLFEADSKPGGLCHSKTVDGFTYDVTGGHILYSKDADAMQWIKDCSGGDEAYCTRDRHTKIRFEDKWVRYPFENGLGDLPKQANFDCLKGYVEAWHARTTDGSSAPTSFGDWVQWRFGDGITKHFMDPYNEKVWKRELNFLTSDWVAGRVPDAPVEDVLRAAVGIETEGYKHQAIFYYPKEGGFQAITDGFASTLTDQIRLNTPVRTIRKQGDGWKVNGEDFDRVVSTLSLNLLPDLVEGMPAGVAEAMRTLEYNSISCFLLALDRAQHPEHSWIYLPHHEQGPANRITYMSNYADSNAPEGKTSFLCEVTVPGGKPYAGKQLEDEVIAGMEYAGLVKRDEILFTDRVDTRFAYIVYDHRFGERRKAALDWLAETGIVPLGRFGQYEYWNSDQCVIAARALAPKLMEEAVRG